MLRWDMRQRLPTKAFALLVGPDQKWLSTIGYLEKVDEYLNKALAG